MMKPAICILGAVRQEIAGIKGRMKVEEKLRFGKTDVWNGTFEGRPVVLVRTGIGKKRAHEALAAVLEKFPIKMILSTGYAGGLDPNLRVGDLVIANRILDLPPEQEGEQKAEEFNSDPKLVEQLLKLPVGQGAKASCGELLTVNEVVTDPETKQELQKHYLAVAIDMETAAMARLAGERDIPFVSVRAISDTAGQKLMDVSPFVEADGEVSKLKAGWYVLTHPLSLKLLKDIRCQANRATNVITKFLSAFIQHRDTD